MKTRFVTLVCIGIQASSLTANAELALPAYPPQEWRLSVTFNFSSDVLLSFLDAKPDEHQFLGPDMLSVWFSDDFEIRGTTSHPVLTRQVQEDRFGGRGLEAIGFVPEVDQPAIYSDVLVWRLRHVPG